MAMMRGIHFVGAALVAMMLATSCERVSSVDDSKEETEVSAPSQYEHLKELEWLVGTWVDIMKTWMLLLPLLGIQTRTSSRSTSLAR